MDRESIEFHIKKKQEKVDMLSDFWNDFIVFKVNVNLSESTFKEVKAKLSSEIALCEKSIQDHKKLL